MQLIREPSPGGAARIVSLDAIRGIAALVVVVFHMLMVLPAIGGPGTAGLAEVIKFWPLRLLWGGYEAVLVFFVLSGFVLALPFLGDHPPSWRAFAVKRVVRLYPAYGAALLAACAAAALLAVGPVGVLSDPFNKWWNEPVTVRVVLHGALMTSDYSNINGAFWSLVHEMRISLIFPLLYMVTRRLGVVAALTCFATVSVGAVYVILSVPFQGWLGATAFTLLKTAYFLVFFVLGILLATHAKQIISLLSGPWKDTRFALLILGVGLMGLHGHLPYEAGGVGVGLGFAVILAVILSTPATGRVLATPFLQALGKISYSLYLSHPAVIYALFHAFHHRLPVVAILALVPPVAFLVAWVLWNVVERPSIAWSRRAASAWQPEIRRSTTGFSNTS